MGEFLAVLAGACFAVAMMYTQKGMRKASATAAVTIALVMNILFYSLMLLWINRNHTLPPLNAAGVAFAVVGGLCGNLMGRTLVYLAVRRIGSARSTLIQLTQTLFATVFGMVFLTEMLTPMTFLGMFFVIFGIYLLSRERVQREQQTTAHSEAAATADAVPWIKTRAAQGMLLALAAGLSMSLADLFRKMSLLLIPSALVSSLIGGLASFVLQVLIVTYQRAWPEIRGLDYSTLKKLALAGTCSGIAVLSLNSALTYTPIAIANALFTTRVWFIIALGPLILGAEERITRVLITSTCLILMGALIIIFT